MPYWNPYVFAAGVVFAVGMAIYTMYNESPNRNRCYGNGYSSNFTNESYTEEFDADADKYAKKKRQEKEKSEDCVICLNDLKVKRRRKLTCGHVFHFDCIDRWLVKNSSCPLCRS